MLDRSRKVFSLWRRRSIRDAIAAVGICFATYIAAEQTDLFDHVYEFAKQYDAYEADELIVVTIVGGFLMVIYALRRAQDLKCEIQKRRNVERINSDQTLRLTAAVNSMSQGLLMFDSAERLIVCNEHYLQMYGLSPQVVQPGLTLLQLLKYRENCGSFNGDPNQYCAEILDNIATGRTTHQSIETPDGRIIHIVNKPMPGGGWVATHHDVTDKVHSQDVIEKQKIQLDVALENISQGLCMFDGAQRLVVSNARFSEIYNIAPDRVRPGLTLSEIVDLRFEAGSSPAMSKEDYLTWRQTLVASEKPSDTITELKNGRIIRIRHQTMSDHGWVATHEDITDQRRREASFRLLFESNPVPMWVFDRDTLRFLAVNDAAIAQYGYSREQFLTMSVSDIRVAKNGDSVSFFRTIPDVQTGQRVGQHQRADGSKIDVAIYSRIMNYENREARLVVIHDITERKLAEEELRRTKMFLDTVIENVPMPILVKTAKDSRFTLLNKAGEELFGFSRDHIIGKTPHEVYDETRADYVLALDKKALLSDKPFVILDHFIPTSKQGVRVVTSKKVAIKGSDGQPEYLLSVIDDVTERRASERRISYMALNDLLTDLPNRAAFNDCLTSALKLAETDGRTFAIMCMDLDNFKEVNDVYGHGVGDLLLRQVADRLRASTDGFFVARLGGDEFTIIVDNLGRAGIGQLVDRLLAAFVPDFELDGHRLRQALSIGIAMYPDDGADAETLMKNADAALYRAKTNSPGTFQFFEAEMAKRLRERSAMQTDLRSAIQCNELQLHYQPQMKMTGEIAGFEALARWHSAKRGMVPPGEFIPLAEESSLILLMGEWVLREACREAVTWDKPLGIAINISPIQFRHGDLPSLVHAVLLETGLAPGRLELEITEGVLIDDFSRAVSILRRLKSLGVQIALDDFGTGYSSLSYLHAFPFDKIKIDRSFISDLETNRHSIAIVRAVIGLARSLSIPILAEGVETQAQHAFLAQEGCDEVQGYLTGRPLAIADYADVVGQKVIATTHSKVG